MGWALGLRLSSADAAILFRFLLKRGLGHRHDRVGQRQPQYPEQRAEDELGAEHQGRREIHGLAGHIGHDQIAIDQLHDGVRSEEHTSELQSLMRISYAVFCLKKKNKKKQI